MFLWSCQVKATTKDKVRLYETPDGNLSIYHHSLIVKKQKGLFEWKKVGDEVANYVIRKGRNSWNSCHHMCEDYLNNVHLDFPDE